MKPSYILKLSRTYDGWQSNEKNQDIPTVVDIDYSFSLSIDGALTINEDYFERNVECGIRIIQGKELFVLRYEDVTNLRDFLNYALSQISDANAQAQSSYKQNEECSGFCDR